MKPVTGALVTKAQPVATEPRAIRPMIEASFFILLLPGRAAQLVRKAALTASLPARQATLTKAEARASRSSSPFDGSDADGQTNVAGRGTGQPGAPHERSANRRPVKADHGSRQSSTQERFDA